MAPPPEEKLTMLGREVLMRVITNAGKVPVYVELPVKSTVGAGGEIHCSTCGLPFVAGADSPTRPVRLHGNHACCWTCAQKFRTCPRCRSCMMMREEITMEQLRACFVEQEREAVEQKKKPDLTKEHVVINLNLFSPSYNQEYAENERWCMFRGMKPYYCPAGWQRIGVYVPGFEETFSSWPVAYHGTASRNILSIIQLGLLNPGMKTELGEEIKVMHGTAYGTGKEIYLTPSIEYAANDLYSEPLQLRDGRWAQAVFQVRVRPDSFKVNKITVTEENWPHSLQYDDFFHNDEIEWRITDREAVMVYGLMVHVTTEHPRVLLNRKKEAMIAGTYPPPQRAKWSWYDRELGFVPYAPGIQVLIETAYQKRAESSRVFFHIGTNHNMYFIDFDIMRQVRFDNESLWRSVKREEVQ